MRRYPAHDHLFMLGAPPGSPYGPAPWCPACGAKGKAGRKPHRLKAPEFRERFRRLLVSRRRGDWQSAGVACVLEVLALDVARLAFLAGMRKALRLTPRRIGYTQAQVRREGERLWWGELGEVKRVSRKKKDREQTKPDKVKR